MLGGYKGEWAIEPVLGQYSTLYSETGLWLKEMINQEMLLVPTSCLMSPQIEYVQCGIGDPTPRVPLGTGLLPFCHIFWSSKCDWTFPASYTALGSSAISKGRNQIAVGWVVSGCPGSTTCFGGIPSLLPMHPHEVLAAFRLRASPRSISVYPCCLL